MLNILGARSILLLLVAVFVGYLTQKTPSYMPWHGNDTWVSLLDIYDKQAANQFRDCDSRLVETSFGKTQVHACGDSNKPSVLLLHGAGSNSLIYGDWIIPPLRKSHYCIAVDYPCDVGRSAPRDLDTKNCPATQQDLAEWVQEVVTGLSVTNSVSIIGYSYGCVVGFVAALHKPQLVDKLVLIAPAAIFAPIEFSWMWRAIAYGLTRTEYTHNWFFRFMSAESDFDMQKSLTVELLQLTNAIRLVSGTILSVPADSFDDEVLQEVIGAHSTLLLLGANETITNATLAAERGKLAGATTKIYEKSGHLLLMEDPREQAAQDVVEFLQSE
jgi:pimeloyl-ACP methyl ester carboxylesterase